MSRYHITLNSNNRKTGNIIVTTSSRDTCPNSCPFKKAGCYANCAPLRFHWDRITKGELGTDFDSFIQNLKTIAKDRVEKLKKKFKDEGDLKRNLKSKPPLRLWQAGDLPGKSNRINIAQVKRMVEALKPFNAFGYTHKPLNKNNIEAIKFCNDNGVTMNLSANNLHHADELYDANIGPVTVTVSSETNKALLTPKGRKVKICPATINDRVHCANCGGGAPLCSRKRDYIIAFPAHGNSVRKVNEIVSQTKC